MMTARYHRDQAELCLEIAWQMSDRNASDMVRAAAVRHFAQAVELEKLAQPLGQTADKHQE
jgi:hypothetical protein